MTNADTVLIIGAAGQIGSELTNALVETHGADKVIASDIRKPDEFRTDIRFELLDTMDGLALASLVKKHNIKIVYQLAAMLSASGEKNPMLAWDLNMRGLLNVLELAREGWIKQLFWPSSIAVFGNSTPKQNTPQFTVTEPNTVYGISKLAGERWCEYYFNKYNVDVRSIRYPGLISPSEPGGGTTDYAVHIFYEALKSGSYTSFLNAETRLPMMYMPDAIRGTIELMQADASKISIRSAYNFSALDFTPVELADSIRKYIPDFVLSFDPDFRQAIADSWPQTVNDQQARNDWGWSPQFNLDNMTKSMLEVLSHKIKKDILVQ
jgi:nucleoside-diphosphate-sugar epimerase